MNTLPAAEIHDALEKLRHKVYGKYRGVVTKVEADTLRIKAKLPAVFGDVETNWAVPCVPYAGPGVGIAFAPEAGSGVWIEFEGGEPSYPIWSGCYWRTDELPSDAKPDVKVIQTVSGIKLTFDDAGKALIITDGHGNTITLDSNGIVLERGGKKVSISDAKVDVNDGSLEVT